MSLFGPAKAHLEAGPSLHNARHHARAVCSPDGSVYVVGGERGTGEMRTMNERGTEWEEPVTQPVEAIEALRPGGSRFAGIGRWRGRDDERPRRLLPLADGRLAIVSQMRCDLMSPNGEVSEAALRTNIRDATVVPGSILLIAVRLQRNDTVEETLLVDPSNGQVRRGPQTSSSHCLVTLPDGRALSFTFEKTSMLVPGADEWRVLAPAPKRLVGPAVVLAGGRAVYVQTSSEDTNGGADAWLYDVDQDRWRSLRAFPDVSSAGPLLLDDGRVALVDNRDGQNAVIVWSPQADEWTIRPIAGRFPQFAAVVAVGSKLLVVGGMRDERHSSEGCWWLTPP
jgi:hypothetical protein